MWTMARQQSPEEIVQTRQVSVGAVLEGRADLRDYHYKHLAVLSDGSVEPERLARLMAAVEHLDATAGSWSPCRRRRTRDADRDPSPQVVRLASPESVVRGSTVSRLSADGLTLAYDARVVATGLSVEIPDNSFTVIVGPNACGKSTLLRALSRMLKPRTGTVLLDGKGIGSYPAKEVARRLGLLPRPR